jgi:hypothetical protein
LSKLEVYRAYPCSLIEPHFLKLIFKNPQGSYGRDSSSESEPARGREHFDRYNFAFSALAFLGVALILVGSYSRRYGVEVVAIWIGLISLVLGIGSMIGR